MARNGLARGLADLTLAARLFPARRRRMVAGAAGALRAAWRAGAWWGLRLGFVLGIAFGAVLMGAILTGVRP